MKLLILRERERERENTFVCAALRPLFERVSIQKAAADTVRAVSLELRLKLSW